MSRKYDFAGWATRNNLRCSDGRVIMKDAFVNDDGKTVPIVWNHQHGDPENVLGHAVLENHEDGVRAYGIFNDTEKGRHAKALVDNGDITALSIYANKLKQQGANVLHGVIREVSLVLGGANPGAFIDSLNLEHSDDPDYDEDEAIIYTGEKLYIAHSLEDEDEEEKEKDNVEETQKKNTGEETVADIFDTLTEKQKTVVYAIIGQALEEVKGGSDDDKEDEKVKHNVFDTYEEQDGGYLSHSDEEAIISLAKSSSVGSLKEAIEIYAEQQGSLAHGFDAEDLEYLFPEYKDVKPGAPELITRDQGWVTSVMNGVHKSPISRIRTKQMDIRDIDGTAGLRGKGYKKGDGKTVPGNPKLLKRTTDPQTVYRKDALHRDDIIDITDFDVVEYQYGIMRQNLNEELATAIMIGDGRDETDDNKISEDHIRSIWHDDDLYTIHVDVDIDAMRNELQGNNTSDNFGENYIYAEAIIQSALYARENFKGSGKPDFYCTPHLVNIMLLARDLNGRRIYQNVSELATALNVGTIHTCEQFAGKTRSFTKDGVEKTKKLLGIFVNLVDYTVGATKGGEITRFSQFDIDFNQEKYLIETRCSGALTKVYSAIALEEDVTAA